MLLIFYIAALAALFNSVSSKTFLDGTEKKIPALCQRSRIEYDDSNATVTNKLFELDLLAQAEVNQTAEYIRLGCPTNYKIFGEFHCIRADYLEQYRTGAMTWTQLFGKRVKKSSFNDINRDKGHCNSHGYPNWLDVRVEFDDNHCIRLSMACMYKFGNFEFPSLISTLMEYPIGPKRPRPGERNQPAPKGIQLPPSSKCWGELDFGDEYCINRDNFVQFLYGSKSWERVFEWARVQNPLSTTTTTQKPLPPRKEIELSILKSVVPMLRPYITSVLNNRVASGTFQEIYFAHPAGMMERKNWKQLVGTWQSDEVRRLGLNRDLERFPVSRTSIAPCWTPSGRKGRCKLMKECYDPSFYASLDTFLDNSCDIGRQGVGICCPLNFTFSGSNKAMSESQINEWNSLMDATEKGFLSSGRTTTPKVKVLNKDEAKVWSWLQPLIKDWIIPNRDPSAVDVQLEIPHDTLYELRKRKNWETEPPSETYLTFRFAFGLPGSRNAYLCYTPSGEPGDCRLVSLCPQPKLYRTLQVFLDHSCSQGNTIGVCCKENESATTVKPSASQLTSLATTTSTTLSKRVQSSSGPKVPTTVATKSPVTSTTRVTAGSQAPTLVTRRVPLKWTPSGSHSKIDTPL